MYKLISEIYQDESGKKIVVDVEKPISHWIVEKINEPLNDELVCGWQIKCPHCKRVQRIWCRSSYIRDMSIRDLPKNGDRIYCGHCGAINIEI